MKDKLLKGKLNKKIDFSLKIENSQLIRYFFLITHN